MFESFGRITRPRFFADPLIDTLVLVGFVICDADVAAHFWVIAIGLGYDVFAGQFIRKCLCSHLTHDLLTTGVAYYLAGSLRLPDSPSE